MKFFAGAALGLIAAAMVGPGPTLAQSGADPVLARGEAIFNDRCKDCHDPAIERALTRAQLAAKTPAEIVQALTVGPMVPIAEGLTQDDKQAVAAFLTAHSAP